MGEQRKPENVLTWVPIKTFVTRIAARSGNPQSATRVDQDLSSLTIY